MKNLTKLMALIIALMMVLCIGATAFATSGDPEPVTPAATKSITLTGGKAGHTYTLYQIFTGTVKNGELTNIQWGSGANDTFQKAYDTAAAAAEAIANKNDARATAQELVANKYLGTGTDVTLSADGEVKFENLAEGYYMIVDTNNNTSPVDGDYSSAYIVKVVTDVTGAIKGSGASSEKTVTDQSGNAGEAAAYSIGDAVPFTLTATTADNVAAYKKYHITFQDKQSAGLDAPTSYTITVLGKTFTLAPGGTAAPQTTDKGTKITVTNATPDSGNTFAITVEFEPTATGATYLDAECNSTDITVDYTSVLNSGAVIGNPGNPNDFHITYSNNPEDDDGGDEGKTPDDKAVVFTYKPVIDKVDADGNPLAGAAFTIYEEVAEGTANAVKGSAIEFATGVEHSKISADKYYIVRAMTTTNDGATFSFDGLADGTYVLVETTVPTGFNPFDSVEFTISSTVAASGIQTLTASEPFTAANPGATTSGEHTLVSGEVYGEIENNSGAKLPETGGIGTTIFYIVGGILVLAALVLLVTRRRMSASK